MFLSCAVLAAAFGGRRHEESQDFRRISEDVTAGGDELIDLRFDDRVGAVLEAPVAGVVGVEAALTERFEEVGAGGEDRGDRVFAEGSGERRADEVEVLFDATGRLREVVEEVDVADAGADAGDEGDDLGAVPAEIGKCFHRFQLHLLRVGALLEDVVGDLAPVFVDAGRVDAAEGRTASDRSPSANFEV